MSDFSVAVERVDGTSVLRPCGELDIATAPIFEQVLRDFVDERSAVAIDLSALTFLDCAGLRPIARALQERDQNTAGVRVFAARPAVERVLELTGLATAARGSSRADGQSARGRSTIS